MKRKIFHTPFGRLMVKVMVAHKQNNAIAMELTPNAAFKGQMVSLMSYFGSMSLVIKGMPRRHQEKLMRDFTSDRAVEFIEHVLLAKLKKIGGLNESFDAQAFLESQDFWSKCE